MIAIIRIKGEVNVSEDIEETLNRLRLRKKFACVVLHADKEILGMLKKIENFVAYGEIDKETFLELIKKRGKPLAGKKKQKPNELKIDAENIVKEFSGGKTEKKIEEFGLKPFFSLHPPRKGIDMKRRYPKGVLGNHKEKINELIMRML